MGNEWYGGRAGEHYYLTVRRLLVGISWVVGPSCVKFVSSSFLWISVSSYSPNHVDFVYSFSAFSSMLAGVCLNSLATL